MNIAAPAHRWLVAISLTAGLGLVSVSATSASAETAYISDKLTVPLRSGPTNRHRIVHQGLPVGTKMEVLQHDDNGEFAEIVTVRGTKGWIREQYLTSQPIARDRLIAAQGEIKTLQARIKSQRSALDAAKQSGKEFSQTSSQLSQELAQTKEQLAALQSISKNAVAEHTENQKLKELNSRLRDELEDINDERDQLRSNVQQRWLMIGGGLVLMGLLLGVLLKSRPRRSAWT